MSVAEPRRILVTGSSSGIGRAIAVRLLRSGCAVALHGRRREPLEELVVVEGVAPERADIVLFDLADRRATDRALAELLAARGRLDGIVLNAGISGHSPLEDPDTAAFDRLIEIDLVAPMRVVRRCLPAIPDGGRIVAIGSVLGRFGIPRGHGYCAAKAGLAGFVRALALDLAPRRINVNAVMPGWVETPMAAEAVAREASHQGVAPDEARRTFESLVPLGRFLAPEEIAPLVELLLGEGGAGITGQAINVCGGVLA